MYQITNEEDLRVTYRNARGLVHAAKPDTVLVSFYDIKDGEKYEVY